MAAPTNRELWFNHCEEMAKPPALRPRASFAELSVMGPAARARFDRSRIDYLLRDRVYLTDNVVWIDKTLTRMLTKSRSYTAVARPALRVSGPSGTGKSTALLWAGARIDLRLRRRNLGLGDRTYLPVIYVSIGDVTSVNTLLACFGQFLGVGPLARGTAEDRLCALARLVREMGTRFVVVDEVQNLATHRIQGAEAAHALKRFAEQTDATMVYVGIDLDTAPLFSAGTGAQWRAHSCGYAMRTYTTVTSARALPWIELIDTFERDLPLCRHEPGSLAVLYRYLFDRTGGKIGSLKHLLLDAALDAIEGGREQITRELLDQIDTDVQLAPRTPRIITSA
ncbi:ATP-binding protein [Nocardia sp. NPDC127606]|uniref:ATP-binding protein n=1 Tax=Nocardia sp. NPDC127606 TaxID=3345406 RepID=UPI003629A6B7